MSLFSLSRLNALKPRTCPDAMVWHLDIQRLVKSHLVDCDHGITCAIDGKDWGGRPGGS